MEVSKKFEKKGKIEYNPLAFYYRDLGIETS